MSFLFIKEAQLFTHDCDPRKEYGLTVDQATEISEFNGDMAEFMSPAQSMGE